VLGPANPPPQHPTPDLLKKDTNERVNRIYGAQIDTCTPYFSPVY
jgi:hypothetical protein